jgi:hypothetical protein
MNEWLEDWETKWNERHKDNVRWETGIAYRTTEVLAIAGAHKAAPPRERERNDEWRFQGRTRQA